MPQYGYDITGGIVDILKGMTDPMRGGLPFFGDFEAKAWGYCGAGLTDGAMGIMALTKKQRDESTWIANKVETYIGYMAEYITCEVREIVGEYFDKYMGEEDLQHFNTAMDALQSIWMDSCASRSCLNETNKDPLKRTEGCCNAVAMESKDCTKAKNYQMKKVEQGDVMCAYESGIFGVCGSDGKCYKCHSILSAQTDAENLIDNWKNNPDLQYGKILDKYTSVDALIAEGKATAFILSILQHLHFLGSEKYNNIQMMEVASEVST